jgi:acyl-CoA thioester hydrolase
MDCKQSACHQVRVYYEDTDSGGVVYYANYLRFAERARTEWLREMGANHQQLLAEHNLLFTVKHVAVDYLAPARLDDLLEVSTDITGCGAATLDMRQIIRHEGRTLAEVTVTLVAVSPEMKVMRLPEFLREACQCVAGSAACSPPACGRG